MKMRGLPSPSADRDLYFLFSARGSTVQCPILPGIATFSISMCLCFYDFQILFIGCAVCRTFREVRDTSSCASCICIMHDTIYIWCSDKDCMIHQHVYDIWWISDLKNGQTWIIACRWTNNLRNIRINKTME